MRLALRLPLRAAAFGAVSAAIAACNLITGAADLGICSGASCDEADVTEPVEQDAQPVVDAAGKDVRADAPVIPSDAGGDAADADADADAGYVGCNGSLPCERVVFVTSVAFTGALGGLSAADKLCQDLADTSTSAARIRGRKFQAWLSTPLSPAANRLPHGTGIYRTPSGRVIATNWNDLTDGALLNGIGEDERGSALMGRSWTGSTNAGLPAASTCDGWTTTNATGLQGNIGGNGSGWSNLTNGDCSSTARLYCFGY